MASVARRYHFTYPEYADLEAHSGAKHEYVAGEVFAMGGGTSTHSALQGELIFLIRSQLRGCVVHSSDLRVRVESSDLSTYPDVTVLCGPEAHPDVDPIAIANPTLLVEVTSPSSEAYDRGEKLLHYQAIPSLRAVLLVSHTERRVTVVSRTPAGWLTQDARQGETAVVTEPSLRLDVDTLYAIVAGKL